MGDFFRPATSPVAQKQYVCVACGWFIPKGEKHMAQTGVYDGAGFSNRFHDECWDAMCDDEFARDGFMTGSYEVPERFKADAAAYWEARRVAALAKATSGTQADGEGR
jgi:hypothetical protein